jgi:succinylglutamate desuccinylase
MNSQSERRPVNSVSPRNRPTRIVHFVQWLRQKRNELLEIQSTPSVEYPAKRSERLRIGRSSSVVLFVGSRRRLIDRTALQPFLRFTLKIQKNRLASSTMRQVCQKPSVQRCAFRKFLTGSRRIGCAFVILIVRHARALGTLRMDTLTSTHSEYKEYS